MDLADLRDVSLIVIAILYSIGTLVVGAAAAVIWWFARKGPKALDQLVSGTVRPALQQVELQLLTVRDQAARLPGNQSIGLGEAPVARRGLLPFRRKRRRFPVLPS
jgi:hypothetical protein